MSKQVITADTVRHALQAGQNCIYLEPGCIVTQQARDDAKKLGFNLVSTGATASMGSPVQTGYAPMGVPVQTGQAPMGASQQTGYAPMNYNAPLHMGSQQHLQQPLQQPMQQQTMQMSQPTMQVTQAVMPQMMPHVTQQTMSVAVPQQVVQPMQQIQPQPIMTTQSMPQSMTQPPQPMVQPIAQPMTQPIQHIIQVSAPNSLPSVNMVSGQNPMAQPSPMLAQQQPMPSQIMAQPGQMVAQASQMMVQPSQDQNDLIARVRAEVLKALPNELKADANLLDTLIKKALAETSCTTCSCEACPSAPPAPALGGNAQVTELAGLLQVNNQALGLGKLQPHSVNMVDVLDRNGRVSYLEWNNTAFKWTFQQPEILVVLEGSLHVKLAGHTLAAVAGDVLSIPAGLELELSSSGYVKCTTVNPA